MTTRKVVTLSLAMFLFAGSAQAAIIRGLGAGFGGITALGDMGRNLEPGFAGNLTVKGPRLVLPLELYMGASVQKKKGTENTRLILMPVFLAARIELGAPASGGQIRPFLRLGLGGVFESGMTSHQGGFENFDPGALMAFGLSKGLGRKLALGLEASYIVVFQSYQRGAEHDGHFIKLGLGLDWLF